MLKELNFAIYAIKKNIQSSAELRSSFVTNVIGMAINNTAFIIIWVFFVKSVGVINGWTAVDIIGLLGFGALSYGIVFSLGAGIRKLPDYIAGGGFDRFMLSPKNLLIRLGTSAFNASAIGDIIFGFCCLVIYGILSQLNIQQVIMITLLVIVSITVFIAAAIFAYSTSFLFVDGNAASSSIFELFMTPTLFNGGAFQGATRFVFTFIIPSLAVGALPVEIIKNMSISQFFVLCIVAIIWLLLSLKFFNWGVKKYESTNFMTFSS
ncbi:MAG: ABC-2 family transporter protein [Patescibacteria group bacterium]|nr:ABC-2 family transporter protein [Patescibacteria group bacterium]